MKDHSGCKNICLNGTLYLLVDIENISEFSDTYSFFFFLMKKSNALKEQWLFLKYISWLQLTLRSIRDLGCTLHLVWKLVSLIEDIVIACLGDSVLLQHQMDLLKLLWKFWAEGLYLC